MCEACEKPSKLINHGGRKRLWELSSSWHCAILGTCLTLSDLRNLARKINVIIQASFPINYQYHGFFVKAAAE
jgi:hypothetical protein